MHRCALLVVLWWVASPGAVFAQGASGLGSPAPATNKPSPAAPAQAPAPAPAAPQARAPAPAPGAPYEQERILVVDAAPYGVDPSVGKFVSDRLQQAAEQLGYSRLAGESATRAMQSVNMPYPPAPADLWRAVYAAQANAGITARVWAEGGRYVVELTVALVDGRGPFFAKGTAGADDLLQVVDGLVAKALPPPGQGHAATPPPAIAQAPPVGGEDALFEPTGDEHLNVPNEPKEPVDRWGVAVSSDSALGVGAGSGFYNHLIGGRIDLRITREIVIGAYAGYTNLRGRQGRVHNLLMYLQVEDRVRVSRRTKLRIPLRLAFGYLPFNGPVVRLAAGLAYPLSKRVELGADLLAPTLWVLPDKDVAVSMNLGLDLSVSL